MDHIQHHNGPRGFGPRIVLPVLALTATGIGWLVWAGAAGPSRARSETHDGRGRGSDIDTADARSFSAARGDRQARLQAARQARRDSEQEAQRIVDDLTASMQSELARNPHYQEHQRCRAQDPSDRARCSDLLNGALNAVMMETLEPELAETVAQLQARWPQHVDAMASKLGTIAADCREPTRALAALSVLRALRPEVPLGLPQRAFAELAERTDPEVQMVMGAYADHALPPGAAKEVAMQIALSDEHAGSTRLAALRALAHADDVRHLEHITTALLDGNVDGALLADGALTRTLARCGQSCALLADALAAASIADATAP